ncbi:MAG: YlxM family DNA-binding protein [Alicyclobacillaceae bacterium]|nr:YlxM family DNA-binding protein [Alicyclobacillaceae bacterium]
MMEKVTRVGDLYDFYGPLLTPRQREMVELHYLDDWSLGEIAAHLGISRQAVHDNLRRAEEQLESYESVLRLAETHRNRQVLLGDLMRAWESVREMVPAEGRARIDLLLQRLAGDDLGSAP